MVRGFVVLLAFLFASATFAAAQEVEEVDKTFGGWEFVEVNHDFKKSGLFLTAYIEHDNYHYQYLDCVYGRLMVGWKPWKWLKFGVNYVPIYEPSGWYHAAEAEVTGTLKLGDFKLSLRERYRHNFTADSNDIRSRIKVVYSIPNTHFAPYFAAEVFTWGGKWKKTRHYFACTYDITSFMQAEAYYLYYAFNGAPAEHIIGVGLNFNL